MSYTKFEQGQTVVVLGPPKDWDNDILYWNKKMAKHIGKQYKIRDVIRNGTQVRLTISEDGYPWLCTHRGYRQLSNIHYFRTKLCLVFFYECHRAIALMALAQWGQRPKPHINRRKLQYVLTMDTHYDTIK